MKTCIYTICKNEIYYIKRFLKKHKDSDYICLLDTGSTDGTYEFLLKETSKYPGLILHQKISDNFRFDVARNYCLNLIPEDVDICIKVDIDEYLSKGWKAELKKVYNKSIPFYGFTYLEYKGCLIRQSKIIRAGHLNTPDIKWEYPVHEDLTYIGTLYQDESVQVDNIVIKHTPLQTRNRKKIAFYNKLLKIRQVEYNDADTLFYSLYMHFQEDDCKESIVLDLISQLAESTISTRKDVVALCKYAFFVYSNVLTRKETKYVKTLYRYACADTHNIIDNIIHKKLIKYFRFYKYFNLTLSNPNENIDLHILRENISEVIPYIKELQESLLSTDTLFKYKKALLLDAEDLLKKLFSDIRSLETCMPLRRLAIEVLLTDHCNLNCAYCNHFAPLAEPHYYDCNEYQKDMQKLSAVFEGQIWDIKLMGGEPLLHPEIEKVIKITRAQLPNCNISILTNGLLLPKMKESFWNACKRYKVKITITNYTSTPESDIMKLVHKYRVNFEYYPNSDEASLDKLHMVKFCVNEKGNTDVVKRFLDCGNANKTITLREGKLYTCPFKATVSHFNRYFGSDVPVSKGNYIDLQGVVDNQTAYRLLSQPTETCSYCYGECSFTDWKKSDHSKEEWLLDEGDTPKFLKDSYINSLVDNVREKNG